MDKRTGGKRESPDARIAWRPAGSRRWRTFIAETGTFALAADIWYCRRIRCLNVVAPSALGLGFFNASLSCVSKESFRCPRRCQPQDSRSALFARKLSALKPQTPMKTVTRFTKIVIGQDLNETRGLRSRIERLEMRIR